MGFLEDDALLLELLFYGDGFDALVARTLKPSPRTAPAKLSAAGKKLIRVEL